MVLSHLVIAQARHRPKRAVMAAANFSRDEWRRRPNSCSLNDLLRFLCWASGTRYQVPLRAGCIGCTADVVNHPHIAVGIRELIDAPEEVLVCCVPDVPRFEEDVAKLILLVPRAVGDRATWTLRPVVCIQTCGFPNSSVLELEEMDRPCPWHPQAERSGSLS